METIFVNGAVHTPTGIVQALAVENGRIAALGDDKTILSLKTEQTQVIDLMGRTVLPGFADSHMHFIMTGECMHRLDLVGVRSVEEIVKRGQDFVNSHTLAPGDWIVGYGFDNNTFEDRRLPDIDDADAISKEHPVVLDRICGHIGTVNRKAIEAAGFDEQTVIPGGVLEKDREGHLNGIVTESALEVVKKCSPRLNLERVKRLIQEMGALCAAQGITCVHSDDLGPEGTEWEILQQAFSELAAEGKCPVRLFEEWEAPNPEELKKKVLSQSLRSFERTDWIRLANIKLIGDGSLGAGTAAMREPYADETENCGICVYSQNAMDEMVELCHDNDLQVACHSIGDRTLEIFLSAVEKAMTKQPKNLTHRVVHCQFGSGDLYRKMAKLHMGADLQPAFVPSDAAIVEQRVGKDRMEQSYAWKTLMDLGIVCGGGSDSPVEGFSPIYGMHCAVNRPAAHEGSTEVFRSAECLSVEEAVKLYTEGPAKLVHAMEEMGTLEAGKFADLVVLDRDLFTIPKAELKDAKVVLTMVGGHVTFHNM